MSAPTAAEPEALPENAEHRFLSVPYYPEYDGMCVCGVQLPRRTTREALHRDYRAHFAEVGQAQALSA